MAAGICNRFFNSDITTKEGMLDLLKNYLEMINLVEEIKMNE